MHTSRIEPLTPPNDKVITNYATLMDVKNIRAHRYPRWIVGNYEYFNTRL